jgi:hypothetical protein
MCCVRPPEVNCHDIAIVARNEVFLVPGVVHLPVGSNLLALESQPVRAGLLMYIIVLV